MAFEPHVVNFTNTGEPRRAQEQRKLPKLIERVRDQALESLTKLFGHMLDTADDTLFDLADKAGTNKDQTLYFDAMRELRIKRKGMEAVFKQELQNGFYDVVGRNELQGGAATYSLDSLSLVKEDELEENLAIDGMVAKAKQRNEEPLRYLARRFDAVVPDIRVEADDLPVYPKRICESFRVATKTLGLDLKAKLVVFKLFERSVMAELSGVYDDLNLFFADNGVLPDLHVRKPRKPATPPPAPKRKMAEDDGLDDIVSAEQQQVDIKAEVFNALRELLATQKSGGMAMGSGGAGAFFDGGFGAPVVPVVETPQLLKALSNLQHDPGVLPAGQPIDLRAALASRLPVVISGRVDAKAVGAVNDDVIDIVSMMFDFILGDANLPDDIKAQLGRLQIPMLKVALVDKSFFSNRNHSARLLLNEMAYAGIGWDPERRGRDGLQGRIETIVQRVLNEFEDDSRLFTELLEEFRGYCEEERRRSAIIEKRTKEAEEGKARSESAKQVVDNLLAKLIGGRSLPPVAHKLLHDVWSKVLFLEHLRAGGADSDAFRHAAQVADVLVKTVTVRTAAERVQLPAMIPGLVRQLRAGFESISYGSLESSALLQDLEALHFQLMRAPVEPVVPADTGLEDLVDSAVMESSVSAQETDLLADALPDTSAADAELLASISVEPARTAMMDVGLGMEGLRMEDIVLESEPMTEPDVDGYIDQVDALQVGSWIELREPDRNTRCKLAARIPTVGKLIFVNRSGVKVAEFTRPGLAVALRRGSVKLLDDAALFDRALEAVISNLRKLKDAADT